MKLIIFGICAVAIVLSSLEVDAAVSVGVYKDDDHPGKCVIDKDTILDEGQVVTTKGCSRTTCSAGGHVEFASCGAKAPAPGCTFGEVKYPNAAYPKCCTNVHICPGKPDGEI